MLTYPDVRAYQGRERNCDIMAAVNLSPGLTIEGSTLRIKYNTEDGRLKASNVLASATSDGTGVTFTFKATVPGDPDKVFHHTSGVIPSNAIGILEMDPSSISLDSGNVKVVYQIDPKLTNLDTVISHF